MDIFYTVMPQYYSCTFIIIIVNTCIIILLVYKKKIVLLVQQIENHLVHRQAVISKIFDVDF